MGQFLKSTAIVFALGITSCASSLSATANMYPANDAASKIGAFTVPYKDVGLQGSVAFTLPTGEGFKGNYTSVDTSTVGWGRIYALSSSGGSVTGTTAAQVSRVSIPGRLDAFGNRGTRVECEYVVNRQTRSGVGACRTNGGAVFNMHFAINQ
jgi:hypothetical protein